MCGSISINGMEISEIPLFIASLNSDERVNLIMGNSYFFDDPLAEALESLKGEERNRFISELMSSLELGEKKMMLESQAFDCLTDDEFQKLQTEILA